MSQVQRSQSAMHSAAPSLRDASAAAVKASSQIGLAGVAQVGNRIKRVNRKKQSARKLKRITKAYIKRMDQAACRVKKTHVLNQLKLILREYFPGTRISKKYVEQMREINHNLLVYMATAAGFMLGKNEVRFMQGHCERFFKLMDVLCNGTNLEALPRKGDSEEVIENHQIRAAASKKSRK